MSGTNSLVLRCGTAEHALVLSTRDIRILDGRFFAPLQAAGYRPLLGLAFIAGLGAPPLNTVLVTHRRSIFLSQLEALLVGLENQRDLVTYSYSYAFSERAGSNGGGTTSGFHVRGLSGVISVQPSGYCDLTLSEAGPAGKGRILEIHDLRRQTKLQTDDWGMLKVMRRAADVGWYEILPPAIEWLRAQSSREVEVLHR
jgi:hypothetical protein